MPPGHGLSTESETSSARSRTAASGWRPRSAGWSAGAGAGGRGRGRDSLFAPAKRLRPILSLLVAEVLKGDPEAVLPAGCAVEMVHTASLILDDLPCMDDATTRRGRPTCHVAHGEATAVLAAFALMNRAFEVLAEGWEGGPDAAARGELARELARAIGTDGMIAGQSVDLLMTDRRDRLPDPRVHPQPQDGRPLHGLGRARGGAGAGARPPRWQRWWPTPRTSASPSRSSTT